MGRMRGRARRAAAEEQQRQEERVEGGHGAAGQGREESPGQSRSTHMNAEGDTAAGVSRVEVTCAGAIYVLNDREALFFGCGT